MDKINIYVPKNVGKILDNDVLLFEIFKKDSHTVNKNKYLNLLIKGFYKQYIADYQQKLDVIKSNLLAFPLPENMAAQLAENILQSIDSHEIPSRKGKNPVKLSLKPTKETEGIIREILSSINGNDYISQLFCRMLVNYCEKPLYEREQVLFKDNYEELSKACEEGRVISFTTIWNKSVIHEVVPYKVDVGQGEMFNYLICAETNPLTGKQEAKSYRLSRIADLNYIPASDNIDPEIKDYLECMIQYGVQYPINDKEETCVKLTDHGETSFSRIYYGRPIVNRIDNREDGHYYYFKGSKEQLFLYFKRFEKDDAEIISPPELRERMIEFHTKVLATYKK